MLRTELGAMLIGICAWAAVAVVACVAVATWDPFWGFFPVLAAVLMAWGLGEFVTRRMADGGSR